ncbi:MAG: 30S ribosomal protein S2 [Candidatus Woesearchaeota archaeon]
MGEELLVPQDIYLKSGIHIGTKFRTKYMSPFIYKIRPDGLSIMNLEEIDRRLKIASNFLAQYNPEDIIVACRRENGWKAVSLFGKATGIRTFIGRYPPGTLTNPKLKTYTEAKLIFVVDPWPDKNIVDDAARVGIPVIALCDTNNQSNNVDFVVPCNNKGKKSLGLIFWVLAREYLKKRVIIRNEEEFKYTLDEFSEE